MMYNKIIFSAANGEQKSVEDGERLSYGRKRDDVDARRAGSRMIIIILCYTKATHVGSLWSQYGIK